MISSNQILIRKSILVNLLVRSSCRKCIWYACKTLSRLRYGLSSITCSWPTCSWSTCSRTCYTTIITSRYNPICWIHWRRYSSCKINLRSLCRYIWNATIYTHSWVYKSCYHCSVLHINDGSIPIHFWYRCHCRTNYKCCWLLWCRICWPWCCHNSYTDLSIVYYYYLNSAILSLILSCCWVYKHIAIHSNSNTIDYWWGWFRWWTDL